MNGKLKRTLTPKQKNILDFITSFSINKGYAPSLEEIGNKFELVISTVHQHIKALKTKGYLKKEDNQPRGVSLFEQTPDSVEIPLLGIIAAGTPIEPIENPEPIKVPKNLVSRQGDFYALKVKGDSMIEDGIWDGDVVIIKSQQTADNGDTVVAVTEDGATLKIFRNKNGTIFLEPRNKRLENIYPQSLEIRGIFKGLIRDNSI
ncbi:repressor LexA [Candidatus Daviesbacteria bacterium RIFCSPLOWO2_01_FULL_39_12]|uniref:LexA repressor n=1 Tax=Candidatus Daviesbacteria bacterium RIFCSPLOWO2_01_FULL_39_12 TaxID=1797785 RepID=A0A1F5KNE9_9BACT|nr:MAG: repressor LexA [Candidatus Daviesbacteria bacterium RIFCSPLOWO2_01_FULL_39_12]